MPRRSASDPLSKIDRIKAWIHLFRGFIEAAHERIMKAPRDLALLNLTFFAVMIVAHWAAFALVQRFVYRPDYQSMLLTLLAMPVSAYMLLGIGLCYRELQRGATVKIKDLFRAHRHLHAWFWTLLLLYAYYLFYVTLIRTMFMLEDYTVVPGIRALIGVLLFLWAGSRIVFSFVFVLEQGMTFRQAVRASFLFTSARFFRVLSLVTVSLLILTLGVAALGVGVLYATSIVLFVYFDTYDHFQKRG